MCVPQRQMFIDLTKKGKIVKKYIGLETKLETSFHNGPPANKGIHNQTFYSVNDNCVSTVDPRNKVMENSRNRLEGLN